ncbi:hypothetical protein [Amycolatopsis sp. CA-230715]|uniref:hypothetical protein n=1 Tax=Amycolatopsis sp. CA-230715 TaxID=2745196 RepID=UPI001C01C429|nr:hypothetical protein [Amycolatopsis sp. CA-230715]QWF85756.1 hypothetical protein HUW46_09236 [Amycolatopsis sp. CA-230715]
MSYNDYTIRKRGVEIRLDATASRPPGWRKAWTMEAGIFRADGVTEKAAAGALAECVRVFLTHYESPRLLMFRDHTAIVELDLGGDIDSLRWCRRIVTPGGRVRMTGFDAASWAEAEADTRHSLVHQSTDWHNDTSVHEAAAYLDSSPRTRDLFGPDELYRYAAWQRAAQAAMKAGRDNWHEWASSHASEFAVSRPTDATY